MFSYEVRMSIQQILSNVRKSVAREAAIAKRLAQDPSHPVLGGLVISKTELEDGGIMYDVLMPGSTETTIEKMAGKAMPFSAYKMRRFVSDEASPTPLMKPVSYGVDLSAEAIKRLASKSKNGSDVDKITEQMRAALDTVEQDGRLKDRSFVIQTPAGSVVAAGRRYGEAYVDRYKSQDEEEIEPLERSVPGEGREARLTRACEAARRLMDPLPPPRGKAKDQDQL